MSYSKQENHYFLWWWHSLTLFNNNPKANNATNGYQKDKPKINCAKFKIVAIGRYVPASRLNNFVIWFSYQTCFICPNLFPEKNFDTVSMWTWNLPRVKMKWPPIEARIWIKLLCFENKTLVLPRAYQITKAHEPSYINNVENLCFTSQITCHSLFVNYPPETTDNWKYFSQKHT